MTLKDWFLSTSSDNAPRIRLMDGGVSTHLENLLKAKNQTFSHRSLWSSSLLLTDEGREVVLQGHKDWLEAGSDIVTTVTYQCNYGVVDQKEFVVPKETMTELLEVGIQLANKAVEGNKGKFVVASSGCYGAALADGSEYTGNYPNVDTAGLTDFHKKKGATMLKQKPDGLAVETVPSAEECAAIVDAFDVMQPDAACWISVSCKDGRTLNEGKPLVDALEAIRAKDPEAKLVHAVGVNCCDSVYIESLLEIVTEDMATKGPRRGIVVYPNSGEEWDAANEAWKEGTASADNDEFSIRLLGAIGTVQKTWEKHGSGPMPRIVVGGCCRTKPSTITGLRHSIDEWESKN